MNEKKELWRMAREVWMKDAESSEEAWQRVVDAIQERIVNDEKLNPWKVAVIDTLVTQFTYSKEHDTDPRKAIHDAMVWEVQVALDPRVSSDAQALIDRGREEMKAELLLEEKP